MNIVLKLTFATSLLMTLATPALAGVSVSNPANKSDVKSPFKLSAAASTCSSAEVSVMGYSLDDSSDSTFFEGTSIDTTVSASAGTHTVHVKAWNADGGLCVDEVAVIVSDSGSNAFPANTIVNSSIETLSGWKAVHDTGGKGSASGSTKLVTSPSIKGNSRMFSSSFKSSGD